MIAVTVCFDWSSCSCLYFSKARSRSWALRLLYTSLCLRKYIAVVKFAMTLSAMNCLRRCTKALNISGFEEFARARSRNASSKCDWLFLEWFSDCTSSIEHIMCSDIVVGSFLGLAIVFSPSLNSFGMEAMSARRLPLKNLVKISLSEP